MKTEYQPGLKEFMVSYMKNGRRIKFYVETVRKSEAIPAAQRQGADPSVKRVSVQELKN